MYGYTPIGNVLIPDPRKSAGKHALCETVPKEFPMRQNRYSYPVGFYVKGDINGCHFKMVKLIKLKDGSFLFPVPTDIRRIRKMKAGDTVDLSISKDRVYHGMHNDLLMALYYKELEEGNKDPSTFYYRLREMGRHEFNEWVNTARTKEERAQRIDRVIQAFRDKQTFKEMKKR
jgi:hypothetical protein